ncbi:MAG: transposase [Caldilineaceae bacterium]|nr:transposase [Caldilineaceae bacterium]
MSNIRRYYIPNALVFITNVTLDREPVLAPDWAVDLLFSTMRKTQAVHPFRLLAYAILPDHFHWLMRVDSPDANFSKVMHSVKRGFTITYKRARGLSGTVRLWQPRYWDHIIRDAEDLQYHFDYIHWNPVKHGYTKKPEAWPYSSYRHWLARGYYQAGWGHDIEPGNLSGSDLE